MNRSWGVAGLTGRTIGTAGTFSPARVPHSLLSSTSSRPVRLAPLIGAPPKVVAQRACSLRMMFLLDRSGSTYGPWGDPTDVVGAAAESLVDLARRSGGGEVTIVPWGSDAPRHLVVGPTNVARKAPELTRALREHTSLGGTDIVAGLLRGAEVLPPAKPDQRTLVFEITDGIAMSDGVAAALSNYPADSVHMVLVDRMNGCTQQMEDGWRAEPFGSVTRVVHLDVLSMATLLATEYANALGLRLSGAPATPTTRRIR